jgi:hypothetical protein
MPAQKSDTAGRQKGWHKHGRRKSEADFGNRKSCVRCRNHDVAAGRKREAATDAGAVHQGNCRLSKHVKPFASLVDSRIGVTDVIFANSQICAYIGTTAEMFALAAHNNDPDKRVRFYSLQSGQQKRNRFAIECISFFRPRQRNGGNAARATGYS